MQNDAASERRERQPPRTVTLASDPLQRLLSASLASVTYMSRCWRPVGRS
ncbi:MAG TPA: hypothetical protein VGP58_04640 [Pyrinomonadaceae bacterium]|nr:hypothetical protein [Pyrinomonadaceae bacterium]